MRRWNGWGESSVQYPLTAKAMAALRAWVGPAAPPRDASLPQVLATVPASNLPSHPLVNVDARDRLLHARGQGLPDWVALRSGRIPAFPDGVARPLDATEVQELLRFASENRVNVIPYGGGTSVVGHINPPESGDPVLTVDMRRMNRLQDLDKTSQLATFGAGASGPEVESQLRAHGLTLGHFPQSFEHSTLGGWVATRSSGQQSLGYGRIEDLFAGGRMITPTGKLTILPHPASAAGPDLRHLVLGSEGRMGILSDVIVRPSPLPERELFLALFFPDFASGQLAVRQMVQMRLPLSMIRLSTATETTTTLMLAGHERSLSLLQRYLSLRGAGEEKSMLLLGFSGSESIVDAARRTALAVAQLSGGIYNRAFAFPFGREWHKNRFRTPYLRNTLWSLGYAVDTLETVVPWTDVDHTITAIEEAVQKPLQAAGEKAHVFTHLSHVYSSGASIYTTMLFRLAPQAEETLRRWQEMKTAASLAITNHQGSISHQHGVGRDHAAYLAPEKGRLGLSIIDSAIKSTDPQGIMNPGKLLQDATEIVRL